jgi:hypothetical protein
MNIHLIDDEDYFHDDAKIKLEKENFCGSFYPYFEIDEFFKKNINKDLSKDIIIIDYELKDETVIDSNFFEQLKTIKYKELILCSILPSFGSESEIIKSQFK